MTITETQKIIQIALFEGGPIKKNDLSGETILEIKKLLSPLNLHLIENETHLEIGLAKEINEIINKQKIQELKTDLSESALQTLAVILYKPKSSKPEIDFVRGVDSTRSIKSLLTRGLIEKTIEKNRNFYIPSIETLKFLGLENVNEIIDFGDISVKLNNLITGE